MNNVPVGIHIVTWNSINHIATCLTSIDQQTYTHRQLVIVDNASRDGTVKWLDEHYPHISLLRNTRNTGYCLGHNQALRISQAPYLLILNPDVVLAPDWIERAVNWMEHHPEVGAYGGKTLRFDYLPGELKEIHYSGIIDTAGLQVFRNRHVIDRGSGQPDQGQCNQAEAIFGFSGACVLYRRQALESIRRQNEFFDEDLFAYKDDFDVSWRLQLVGWQCWYDPQARAFHYRQAKGISGTSEKLLAKNHWQRQGYISFYSYRNHWLVLIKNESWSSLRADLIFILWYELRKFFYLLFVHPAALRSIPSIIRLWSKMRAKHQAIQAGAKQKPVDVRRWFLQ